MYVKFIRWFFFGFLLTAYSAFYKNDIHAQKLHLQLV